MIEPEFPNEHPSVPVREHEVLMSFTNDDDALLFRDWWEIWGKHLFGDYAKASEPGTRGQGMPSRQEMYAMLKKRSEELQARAMLEGPTDERWYSDE